MMITAFAILAALGIGAVLGYLYRHTRPKIIRPCDRCGTWQEGDE